MRSTGLRRGIAVIITGMVAALLPLVAAAPAHADADCPSEAYKAPLMLTGCDDTVPPQTTITAINPAPNALKFVRSTTLSFAFAAQHEAGDSGTIGFECMLYNSAVAPAESDAANWASCDDGTKTYTDLAQTGAVAYTFKVRAVDVTDRNIIAFDDNPLSSPDPDEADHDLSPAAATVSVDTVAPNTFLTSAPTDELRPDWPVAATTSPQVTLNTNEAGTFRCLLNGKNYPCRSGVNTLRNLPSGNKTLVVRAVDRAGNVDPSASTAKFWVPSNIKKTGKSSSWKRVNAAGYFGNDYLTADTVGATLTVKRQSGVEELRLFAPTGSRSGRIEVRVGESQWYSIDLRSKQPVRQQMFLVRDEYSTPRSGDIQIRVKSLPRGGSVSVDAYVARR